MSNVPANLKYTKDHEWAKLEGKTVTMGITAFAVEQLGDIVFVDLPKKGDSVKAHGTCGAVESTKATSDIFSPVTGKIVDVNSALSDAPETINQDPYEKGWLVKIEIADAKELDALMDEAKYTEHCKTAKH
ncbi:MAG TPA: glycine cleavage system protein GcvH [Myxococcales bacterium]|jgi:glycine cleavage system H protein